MSDPYSILGVSRDATDDEIKKKYRELCRRYHPDVNPGNAAAEEMFKEVQQAYQQVMDQRKNGGGDFFSDFYGGGYGGHSGGGSEYDTHMSAAANYIRSGHYSEAVHVLDGISEHTAQWYYFYGVAHSGLGNNAAALSYAQMAVNLEPSNPQYNNFLAQLQMGAQWYQQRQQSYGGMRIGGNYCMEMCLMTVCCNMCGGRVCFCGC